MQSLTFVLISSGCSDRFTSTCGHSRGVVLVRIHIGSGYLSYHNTWLLVHIFSQLIKLKGLQGKVMKSTYTCLPGNYGELKRGPWTMQIIYRIYTRKFAHKQTHIRQHPYWHWQQEQLLSGGRASRGKSAEDILSLHNFYSTFTTENVSRRKLRSRSGSTTFTILTVDSLYQPH